MVSHSEKRIDVGLALVRPTVDAIEALLMAYPKAERVYLYSLTFKDEAMPAVVVVDYDGTVHQGVHGDTRTALDMSLVTLGNALDFGEWPRVHRNVIVGDPVCDYVSVESYDGIDLDEHERVDPASCVTTWATSKTAEAKATGHVDDPCSYNGNHITPSMKTRVHCNVKIRNSNRSKSKE